jgi:hypothetical protein
VALKTEIMKLIHLGNEIDTTKEQELLSDNENGFKVTVKYKEDSWMSKHEGRQVVDVFNNCTEVHYMYDTVIRKYEKRIAFESDIHQTGCTRSVDDIEIVIVELATNRVLAF